MLAVKEKRPKPKESSYDANHRPVATWITHQDYDLLDKLAKINKVKISVYLRAIIVDALADEQLSSTNLKD